MKRLEKGLMGKVKQGITTVALAGTLAFGNGCVSLGARPHY